MPNFKVTIIPAGDGPVSIHDIKGEDGPSFETIYPLINAELIEITQGKWNDVKNNIIFDCDIYCDEEAKQALTKVREELQEAKQALDN